MLRAHLVEILRVEAAHVLRHVHAHESHCRAALVLRGVLHGVRLRAGKIRRGHAGVHVRLGLLHLLDHLLVFFARLHAGNAEGDDLDAAQIAPLGGKNVVERLRDLHRVAGQGTVADAHGGDLRKRGLKRGQKLGLELAVDLVAGIGRFHIAAEVRIEQQRVRDAVAVFTEAADGDVKIDAGGLVHDTERHRRGRAVLVANELLGVEVVHALILGGDAAEGEALADRLEHLHDVRGEIAAREERGLRGDVIDVLARLGADVYDLTLLDDHHALSVRHGDDGAVGDDVVETIVGPAGNALAALNGQHVRAKRVAVEIFLPLIGKNAGNGADASSEKTHESMLLSGFEKS